METDPEEVKRNALVAARVRLNIGLSLIREVYYSHATDRIGLLKHIHTLEDFEHELWLRGLPAPGDEA